MEEMKPQKLENKEQEIVFSKSIKAGKRIYYIDVKRNRKDDLFVAITESKKIISGFDEDIKVSYEKHKIFLYKEDFDKFVESLNDVITFIKMNDSSDADEPKDKFSDIHEASPSLPTEFSIEEFEK